MKAACSLRYPRQALCIATLLLAAFTSHAVAQDTTLADFAAQRSRIEHDLRDGRTYVEIQPEDRASVLAALQRIGSALEGAGGTAQLPGEERLRVFNDQELINTILTRAKADSRTVCEGGRSLGSHIASVQCLTVAERRRREEQSRDAMRKVQDKAALKTRSGEKP